jgi:ubiquinone/menaquinone biosynthesis C-methylase UbiE/uncharacterized protein YbaR (Trm112 family)
VSLQAPAGAVQETRVPLDQLLPILRCPSCEVADDLVLEGDELLCDRCQMRFLVEGGVPLMLWEPRAVQRMPADHESNPIDESVLQWLDTVPGWTLNLGAGASVRRPARCIELEYSIFRNTSVVGDAHRLPFKDGTFDAIVSYNTFEHLADPPAAAAELRRVLKPGGELRLQTAFLQPLHEEPAHFYGATEFGVRRWFSGFDIEECFVPGNMNPVFALAWLCSAALWHLDVEQGSERRQRVGDTTLRYWEDLWAKRFAPHPEDSPAAYVQALSQPAQKHVAFGHELQATAPGDEYRPQPGDLPPSSSTNDLVEILRCPCCESTAHMRRTGGFISCDGCRRRFPIVAGVPVMLCEERDVQVMPLDHESNPIGDSVLDWLDSLPGWSLNLGAGASERRPARCVELEYSIFRNTSVVGDAHRLPFQDATFDAVVSYNTFEHLADPPVAAAELLRVLKPGGQLRLQTAFLQPLHEEPAHFYNATEFGVRKWFSDFDIQACFVPPEMGPAHALGWLANHVLYHVRDTQGPGMEALVAKLRLAQFARYWDVPSTRHGFLNVLFDQMPDRLSHFSAGFEIRATRPS